MTEEPLVQLSTAEARVLGSLVEKDLTTPDYYPLTLNALTNACNQINNRDPVVAFGEQEVARAVETLRDKRLAFRFDGAESRVAKFGHRLGEAFSLGRPEMSVLCVLLLRGPQTLGEVRGRTGRMHAFGSLEEAQGLLESLCSRAPALVTRLPRATGFKESRYAHLFCGVPAFAEPAGASESSPADPDRISKLEAEVASLRREVEQLRQDVANLRMPLDGNVG